MNTGIYKIWWENNKYYYFGQAVYFPRRKGSHRSQLRKNIHPNRRLQRLYHKYGMPRIELIERCESSMLNEREQSLLAVHFKKRFCCNLVLWPGSQKGLKHSAKTLKKMAASRKGILLSAEHKERIKQGMLNHSFDKVRLAKHWAGMNNPRSKMVLDTATGIYYDTLVEAVNAKSLKYKQASEFLRGRSKNRTSLIYA
jgi:group I intron endonuclease